MAPKRQVGSQSYDSDEVRYRARRYNASVEPWQKFSTMWDQVQLRSSTGKDESRLLRRNYSMCGNTDEQSMVPLVDHSGNRQLPTYAGYVPSLPIRQQQRTHTANLKNTTMRRNYPNHPLGKKEVKTVRPMSTMVTLVHPHNPFRLLKVD